MISHKTSDFCLLLKRQTCRYEPAFHMAVVGQSGTAVAQCGRGTGFSSLPQPSPPLLHLSDYSRGSAANPKCAAAGFIGDTPKSEIHWAFTSRSRPQYSVKCLYLTNFERPFLKYGFLLNAQIVFPTSKSSQSGFSSTNILAM